jgi:hypothetical protein
VANGDGEWWIYDELAAGDRAARREEITADRTRIRDPKWWVGGLVAAVEVGGGYEAVAAALGDGRFTPSNVLELALVPFAVGAVVTLATALRRQ